MGKKNIIFIDLSVLKGSQYYLFPDDTNHGKYVIGKEKVNNKSEHAMTLTELLVAVAIMGVVMVGTLAIDSSVHKMQGNITSGTALSMRSSAAMVDITKNVSLMTGNFTNSGFNTVASRYCIRQDVNNTGASNNTPADYADDRWICYQKVGFDVLKCNRPNANDCPGGSFILITGVNAALQLLPVADSTVGTQLLAIDVSLTNRMNPGVARSLDNPEITLQSRIFPLSHGWSSF